jgi:hypothetical protein
VIKTRRDVIFHDLPLLASAPANSDIAPLWNDIPFPERLVTRDISYAKAYSINGTSADDHPAMTKAATLPLLHILTLIMTSCMRLLYFCHIILFHTVSVIH